jgi:hypothetical protein
MLEDNYIRHKLQGENILWLSGQYPKRGKIPKERLDLGLNLEVTLVLCGTQKL